MCVSLSLSLCVCVCACVCFVFLSMRLAFWVCVPHFGVCIPHFYLISFRDTINYFRRIFSFKSVVIFESESFSDNYFHVCEIM